MATKLEQLLLKEAQLKAQIQQAKAAERTLEKKRDTRRKILVGAAVLARVQNGEWPQDDLTRMMDGFLSRPNERELFGLDGDGAVGREEKSQQTGGAKPKPAAKASAKKAAGMGTKKTAKALPEKPVDLDNEFNL